MPNTEESFSNSYRERLQTYHRQPWSFVVGLIEDLRLVCRSFHLQDIVIHHLSLLQPEK